MVRRVFHSILCLTAGAITLGAHALAQAPERPSTSRKEGANAPSPTKDGQDHQKAPDREAAAGKQHAENTRESDFADMMRPFVFLEIRFVATVCELSREQRQAIARLSKPMIDDLAKELAQEERKQDGRSTRRELEQ